MQDVSKNFLDALKGSNNPIMQVDAWYDGELIYPNLPVVSGEVTADITRIIAYGCSLIVQGDDIALLPLDFNSPLAPYGSELQIRAGQQITSTPELLSCGWFRIDDSDPHETWVPYLQKKGTITQGFRGVRVDVNGSDRMSYVDDNAMLAPEQPASLTSVLDEITRLAKDDIPVTDLSGITDAAVPKSIAYGQSRTSNIQQLADILNRRARSNPDGALNLYADVMSTSVWTVSVGETAVKFSNKLTRDKLYNAVVSVGEAVDLPMLGVAQETSGPLRYDGPFGRVPLGHASPFITTQASASADATTTLQNRIADRVVFVQVECIANSALELGDTITVVQPNRTLTGLIVGYSLPLPLSTMVLTMTVPRIQIWGI